MLLPRPTAANWANAATCSLCHELLRHVRTCQVWLQTHPTQWTTTTIPIWTLFEQTLYVLAKWVQAFWSRIFVSCQHVSEWVFCILLHRHVSGHNWTVYGWRLALTMNKGAMRRGIFGSAVFKVLWQDLEMREFAVNWMPHTGNEAQHWSCYEICHNRLEWFCHEGDRLSWITAVSEMWVRTFEWELKSKALNVTIHMYYENASFGKINHWESCWSFYMLFCVTPFHRVTLWRHSITSHFCSTTYVLCLVRSILNWLNSLSGHS